MVWDDFLDRFFLGYLGSPRPRTFQSPALPALPGEVISRCFVVLRRRPRICSGHRTRFHRARRSRRTAAGTDAAPGSGGVARRPARPTAAGAEHLPLAAALFRHREPGAGGASGARGARRVDVETGEGGKGGWDESRTAWGEVEHV